jgi:hypothetical protein
MIVKTTPANHRINKNTIIKTKSLNNLNLNNNPRGRQAIIRVQMKK